MYSRAHIFSLVSSWGALKPCWKLGAQDWQLFDCPKVQSWASSRFHDAQLSAWRQNTIMFTIDPAAPVSQWHSHTLEKQSTYHHDAKWSIQRPNGTALYATYSNHVCMMRSDGPTAQSWAAHNASISTMCTDQFDGPSHAQLQYIYFPGLCEGSLTAQQCCHAREQSAHQSDLVLHAPFSALRLL